MIRPLALLGVVALLAWPVRATLLRAHWTSLAPRSAIVLWQAVALAVWTAIVGACVELVMSSSPDLPRRRHVADFPTTATVPLPRRALTPDEIFGLTAGLIVAAVLLGAVLIRAVGLMRSRAAQRTLLDLVASERAEAPGALVLDNPQMAAYSVPGHRSRIVVSRGALDALSSEELAAVLAHERAHVRSRHHLVLFAFGSLTAALPRSATAAAVSEHVETLVEMAADDRAIGECGSTALAGALGRLGAGPGGAVVGGRAPAITRRMERALTPRHGAWIAALGSTVSAACVLALPFLVAFGGR